MKLHHPPGHLAPFSGPPEPFILVMEEGSHFPRPCFYTPPPPPPPHTPFQCVAAPQTQRRLSQISGPSDSGLISRCVPHPTKICPPVPVVLRSRVLRSRVLRPRIDYQVRASPLQMQGAYQLHGASSGARCAAPYRMPVQALPSYTGHPVSVQRPMGGPSSPT